MTRHFWAVLRDSKTYQKCIRKYLIFVFILKYATLLTFLQFIMLISAGWRTGRLVRRVYSGHMIFHNPIWFLPFSWPALPCSELPCPPTIYYVSLYGKGFWKEIFHSVLSVPASDFVLGICEHCCYVLVFKCGLGCSISLPYLPFCLIWEYNVLTVYISGMW